MKSLREQLMAKEKETYTSHRQNSQWNRAQTLIIWRILFDHRNYCYARKRLTFVEPLVASPHSVI